MTGKPCCAIEAMKTVVRRLLLVSAPLSRVARFLGVVVSSAIHHANSYADAAGISEMPKEGQRIEKPAAPLSYVRKTGNFLTKKPGVFCMLTKRQRAGIENALLAKKTAKNKRCPVGARWRFGPLGSRHSLTPVASSVQRILLLRAKQLFALLHTRVMHMWVNGCGSF